MFDNIPNEIKRLRQWCLWRRVQLPDRVAKHPFQTNGKMAKVNDATTWNSYKACVDVYAKGGYDGLGFIFTNDDPFCGIDFDHVIDERGNIKKWSRHLLDRLNSYTEVSQSGTGLHVLVRACSVKLNRRVMIDGQGLEVYFSSRYFAITGRRLMEYPATIEPRDAELTRLADKHLMLPEPSPIKLVLPSLIRTKTVIIELTSKEQRVIELAMKKYRKRFAKLMEGDITRFEGDASRADLSICGMLATIINDPAIIERIWLATPFGKRHKVVTRADYRIRTIQKSIAGSCH